MVVTKLDIGIDPLVTPVGYLGIPLVSPLSNPLNSHLVVDYVSATPSWYGITIVCWLRFDDKELPTKDMVILVIILIFFW